MTIKFPKFLTKNLITHTDYISDGGSSSATNRHKLIDRNQDVIYSTIGDTVPAVITWTPPAGTTINRIFIQNHNWDAFTITYNGGSNFSTPISVSTGNTWKYHYFEFTSVEITTVEFNITSAMSGTIGTAAQIYCGLEIFEMEATASGEFDPIPDPSQKLIKISDGTTFKAFIKKNLGYEYRLIGVSTSEKANYSTLYDYNRFSSFVHIPEASITSGEWNGIANHYHWINGFDFESYTNRNGVDGYNGRLVLEQSGGVG